MIRKLALGLARVAVSGVLLAHGALGAEQSKPGTYAGETCQALHAIGHRQAALVVTCRWPERTTRFMCGSVAFDDRARVVQAEAIDPACVAP